MLKLAPSVRLVSMRFSFSNPKIVPTSLKMKAPATVEEEAMRRERHSGTMVIEPTENCSLAEFPQGLVDIRYHIVDAFYQPRPNPKDPYGKRVYWMVHFLFCRREFIDTSLVFQAVADVMLADLAKICTDALWRVRAFSNPFYQDGLEIAGQSAISINLEARVPLLNGDGTPVMRWHKDESGKRVGDAPQPLKARYYLRVR